MNTVQVYSTHLVLALVLAPLLSGIINRVKAVFAGRHGKPVLQLYYDLAKLSGKGEVISRTTSRVFQVGPAVSLVAAVVALALLPLGGAPSPLRFQGDFLLAAYLLGLGRFALILAALDTGSPFEGMGASREAAFSALAEPVLFLCLLAAVGTASAMGLPFDMSLSTLFGGETARAWFCGRPEMLFIPAVIFVLLLVENCRIPVDDPNTHLELTMIHEVMILDHSGPNLAFILYGSALKLYFFASLAAGLLVPSFFPGETASAGAEMPLLWAQSAIFLIVVLLCAVLVGVVESIMARLRMAFVPRLLGSAGVLAAFALILTLVR